eukprot:2440824-Amphidinium_carterae.1
MPDMPVPKDLTVPTPSSSAAAVPSGATTCVASDGTPVIFPRGFKAPPQMVIDALVPVPKMKPAPSSRSSGTPASAAEPIVLTEVGERMLHLAQARTNVIGDGTQVPPLVKVAPKPAPLSVDNSPENHMRWQRYYESLEQVTEAARSEAARAKPSSSGTQSATNNPVPSSSAASAETEEGGGIHSRTSSANKIPIPPKYIPQPPADDTPMEH